MLLSSSLKTLSHLPTPSLSLLWPSAQFEVTRGSLDPSLQPNKPGNLNTVSAGCTFSGSAHFKDVHVFLAALQNLELRFIAHPPHEPRLSIPTSGSSATAHRPPRHTALIRMRMVMHLLRVRRWARSLHTTSILSLSFQGGVRIGNETQVGRTAKSRHSPPPHNDPDDTILPFGHTQNCFSCCLQYEAKDSKCRRVYMGHKLAISR